MMGVATYLELILARGTSSTTPRFLSFVVPAGGHGASGGGTHTDVQQAAGSRACTRFDSRIFLYKAKWAIKMCRLPIISQVEPGVSDMQKRTRAGKSKTQMNKKKYTPVLVVLLI